ncbi:hypothetical protein MUG87_17455 [Ectobacillus sp. JY-23]|uniref:hypothetical protein n=1 Tax=Ectobacillus sp. JY-23 TaxID=2933872 RepID=UPI001FF54992|nr:hypothetical protein [Ectobacillus sp. JY-23]UOY92198.1 hypothetical protein MUG87_17455 [Ectobacillus sp. JY-23]
MEALEITASDYQRAQADYENLLKKLDAQAPDIVRILFQEEHEQKLQIKRKFNTLFIHSANVVVLLREGMAIYLERNEVVDMIQTIDELYKHVQPQEKEVNRSSYTKSLSQ